MTIDDEGWALWSAQPRCVHNRITARWDYPDSIHVRWFASAAPASVHIFLHPCAAAAANSRWESAGILSAQRGTLEGENEHN